MHDVYRGLPWAHHTWVTSTCKRMYFRKALCYRRGSQSITEIAMLFSELPASMRVRSIPVEDCLATMEALKDAMGPRFSAFTHWMPATGHSASVRVLLTAPHNQAVPLREAMSAEAAAQELCSRFILEARFPSQGIRSQRVWEVRRTLLNEREAAVVMAGWM